MRSPESDIPKQSNYALSPEAFKALLARIFEKYYALDFILPLTEENGALIEVNAEITRDTELADYSITLTYKVGIVYNTAVFAFDEVAAFDVAEDYIGDLKAPGISSLIELLTLLYKHATYSSGVPENIVAAASSTASASQK